jgi:hypothetical protein
MAEILKFVYDIILFFFLFILATEGLNCKPCFYLYQIFLFVLQSVHNLVSYFRNIIFVSFFHYSTYGMSNGCRLSKIFRLLLWDYVHYLPMCMGLKTRHMSCHLVIVLTPIIWERIFSMEGKKNSRKYRILVKFKRNGVKLINN